VKRRSQFVALAIGLLAIATSALLVPAAAVPSEALTTARIPKAKFYDVRVTTDLDTKWVNGGCEQPYGCGDQYQGTFTSSRTYKNVRIAFKPFRREFVSVESPLQAKGEGSGKYDHRSKFCERDVHAFTGPATFSLRARYPLSNEEQPSVELGDNASANFGESCSPRIERVPVAARANGSLVAGDMSAHGVSLRMLVGLTAKPGFPIDRLMAGKGFKITLAGKSIVRKEDFETQKQANVTTGSTRVVFTPSSRTAASVHNPHAAGTTCPTTYDEWWSKKRRACFLVSASASWRHTITWKQDDSMGRPCKGSDLRSMSWTIPAAPFWVGETFPVGYTGSGARTYDFFEKPVKATLERRVSGGAWEYGCVPLLKRDCGKRTVTFRDAAPSFATIDGSYAIVPTSATSVAPFRACGLVVGEGRFRLGPGQSASGGWGGFVPFPVPAANDEDLAKRLLGVRVGGSLTLRGTGGPYPVAPGSGLPVETGSFTGKLVFKRVS
jgi:hypothetical protein